MVLGIGIKRGNGESKKYRPNPLREIKIMRDLRFKKEYGSGHHEKAGKRGIKEIQTETISGGQNYEGFEIDESVQY